MKAKTFTKSKIVGGFNAMKRHAGANLQWAKKTAARKAKKHARKLGQNKAGRMAGQVMTVILGTILIVAVAIPVTNQVINDTNLSGLTETIVNFIPLFLGLAGLVLAMSLVS
jgi:hypothetical protein